MSTTPTKRELREQRRAARREAERAQAAREARRRRAWRLAAVAGVAVVAVVIAVAVSASGGPDQPSGPATGGAEAAALFAGIPEHDGVLGDPNAPVTLTEYVDLQCPVCAAASKQTLPTIVNDYVRTGKVKLDARTLHFIGPDSTRAAKVAAAAERQGRLWPFLEVFYANQGQENSGYATDAFLERLARETPGLDVDQLQSDLGSPPAQTLIRRAEREANRLGVSGTPTFFVQQGNGTPQLLELSALDAGSVTAAIDSALGEQ
jgi:protein-disulfide isomerase